MITTDSEKYNEIVLTFASAICAGIGKTVGEERRIVEQAVRLADTLVTTLNRQRVTPPPAPPWLLPDELITQLTLAPDYPTDQVISDSDHTIIRNTGTIQRGDKIWSLNTFSDVSELAIGQAIQPGMTIQRAH